MKRNLLKLLFFALLLFSIMTLSACGKGDEPPENPGNEPEHTCVYNKQVNEAKYLKNDAGCTERQSFYYSCECGNFGSGSYTVGSFKHTVDEYGECTLCDYYESVGLVFSLYNSEKGKEYELTGMGTCADTDVVIPAYYNGIPVSRISYNFEISNAKSLTIPETIKQINSRNQSGSPLSVINYNGTLEDWLNVYVEYSELFEAIDAFYLNGTLITNLIVPEGTTKIDRHFSHWSWLKSVTIPASVERIRGSFECCSNLESVTIEANGMSFGSNVFSDCYNLKNVSINGTFKTQGELFKNCSSLKSVTLNGASAIEEAMFYNCYSLSEITIPKSVTSIHQSAFSGCTSLKSITVEEGNTSYKFDSGKLVELSSGTVIFSTVKALPVYDSNVVVLGDFAFDVSDTPVLVGYHGESKDVVLPADYNGESYVIGSKAFYYKKTDIRRLYLSSGISSIESDALRNLTNLIWLGFDAGFEAEIPEYAFRYCYKLVEIYNPNSISLDDAGLENSTIVNIYTSEDGSRLKETADGYTFYLDYYHTYLVDYVGEYVNISLPSSAPDGNHTMGRYSISPYAFSNLRLVTVLIPGKVIDVGAKAFYNNNYLRFVDISEGVIAVGKEAFNNCLSIDRIYLPSTLGNVGENAFSESHKLYFNGNINDYCSINFDGSLVAESSSQQIRDKYRIYVGGKRIGDYRSIVLDSDVKFIGNHAFSNWDWLYSFKMSENIHTIGEYAFKNCKKLTMFTVEAKVMMIGENAFEGCSGLSTVIDLAILGIEPGSIENGRIANYAKFVLNTALPQQDGFLYTIKDGVCYLLGYNGEQKNIVLPDKLSGMDYVIYRAFAGLDITSITLSPGVTEISSLSFYECRKLRQVILHENIKKIYTDSFEGCINLVYSEYDNCLYLGNESNPYLALIKATKYDITSCSVHSDCKAIAGGAFNGNYNFESIFIPIGVTYLGTAFDNHAHLKDVWYEGSEDDWNNMEKFTADYYCPIDENTQIHFSSERIEEE